MIVTPPRKSTSPSLKDLLDQASNDKPTVEETPTVETVQPAPGSEIDEQPVDDVVVDDNPDDDDVHEDVNDDVTLIPADENPTHTWEENHDHNLAKLHPDVIQQGELTEHSRVATTTYETHYSPESENDDKGRKGLVENDEEPNVYAEEYKD